MNTPLQFNFSNIRTAFAFDAWWRVAIELLLIGIVVFWVVRFLQGTRGARMLKGIAFLLLISFLIVNLVNKFIVPVAEIVFLYGQMLFFASFALAVVFQPELRRADAARRNSAVPPAFKPDRR